MSDEIFDPEIHAVDKDGNPSMNKDGSFRKKRRDAGTAKSSRTARPKVAGALGTARDRYRKGVANFLAIPAAVATMVDPVDGYCASQLIDPMAEAVADWAVEDPRVAAAVEKLAQAGPVGAVLGVVVMGAVQFAHNHGKIPEPMARAMGATPRSVIEQKLRQRGEQLQAQQRAEAEAQHMRAADGVMAGV